MTAKVQTLPPIYTLGVRVFKGFVQECGELLKRLKVASRDESWSIVCFAVTGEAFELRDGRLRRC